MQEILPYDLPYAIDITLYKHNYYDNLIACYLKKHSRYTSIPNSSDSFVVNIDDFRTIINYKFRRELDSMKSLTEVELSKNTNSIFFINRIIDNFQNLKYIKINVSDKRKFSRLIETSPNRAVINFDYKILSSVIDLTTYFTKKSEYLNFNNILKKIGLINPDIFGTRISYINTTSQELINLLAKFEEIITREDTEYSEKDINNYVNVIDLIYDIIDKKIETDNCRLILVTDYVN